jgi:hypothetical protein
VLDARRLPLPFTASTSLSDGMTEMRERDRELDRSLPTDFRAAGVLLRPRDDLPDAFGVPVDTSGGMVNATADLRPLASDAGADVAVAAAGVGEAMGGEGRAPAPLLMDALEVDRAGDLALVEGVDAVGVATAAADTETRGVFLAEAMGVETFRGVVPFISTSPSSASTSSSALLAAAFFPPFPALPLVLPALVFLAGVGTFSSTSTSSTGAAGSSAASTFARLPLPLPFFGVSAAGAGAASTTGSGSGSGAGCFVTAFPFPLAALGAATGSGTAASATANENLSKIPLVFDGTRR